MIVPTQYWLGDVALAYTRIKWVLAYRGTQYIPVVFYQPTSMYEELSALPRDVAGVTLKVSYQGKDGASVTEIKGVQIVKIEKVATSEEPDGCRVTIADRRFRLQAEIMPQNWNMLYQGRYLRGSALGAVDPYDVENALRDLILEEAPFDGHTRGDWDDFAHESPFPASGPTIPDDQAYGGQPLASGLQKVMDWWGFDLLVDTDGEFYFDTRYAKPGAEDEGLNIIKQYYDNFEWIDTAPDVSNAVKNGLLPKKIKVPFQERHTLQVPYENPVPESFKKTEVLGQPRRGLSSFAELKLIPVYQTLGRFFDYENLGIMYGVKLSQKPRKNFMSSTMEGTELYHGVGTKAGVERQKDFTLSLIIQASERTHYAIVNGGKDPSLAAAWSDFALGAVGPDGTVEPRGAIGDWTEFYDKLPERDRLFTNRAPAGTHVARLAIVKTHTFKDIFRQTKEVKDRIEAAGYPTTEGRPKWSKTRTMAEAAPFNVSWAAKESGVIALSLDKLAAEPGSEAIMGTPVTVKTLLDNSGTLAGINKLYRAMKADVVNSREALVFNTDYKMWIYVTATRNFPNTEDKYWIETIDGDPDGDLDEMTLDVDPRYFAYRDFVNHTQAPGLAKHLHEEARPNSANGFDGYGKILNRATIEARAKARAELTLAALKEPAAWSHEFLNINVITSEIKKLTGAIDSVLLDINGKVVKGEITMGRRSSDINRREESIMRAIRQTKKLGGKRMGG